MLPWSAGYVSFNYPLLVSRAAPEYLIIYAAVQSFEAVDIRS